MVQKEIWSEKIYARNLQKNVEAKMVAIVELNIRAAIMNNRMSHSGEDVYQFVHILLLFKLADNRRTQQAIGIKSPDVKFHLRKQ